MRRTCLRVCAPYWNADQQELYVFRVDDHPRPAGLFRPDAAFGSHPYDHDRPCGRISCVCCLPTARARACICGFISISYGRHLITARDPSGCSSPASSRPRARAALEGCTAQVSSWTRLSDAAAPLRIKTTANYVNGRLAALQARQDGYDTAILLNEAGDVSEGPAACFFMVRDGRLVTPGYQPQHPREHHPGYPDPMRRGTGPAKGSSSGASRAASSMPAMRRFFCGTGQGDRNRS